MKPLKKKTQKQLEQPVNDANGKKMRTIALPEKVFDGKINRALLHDIVIMYRANMRSGSASTKTRADVRGGGKKPWRQKGTGRARTGSIRNPIWRGGGVVFGPHPRDFGFKMPKQVKKIALRSVLNEKFASDKLLIVDSVKASSPKTKDFANVVRSFGLNGREKAVLIL